MMKQQMEKIYSTIPLHEIPWNSEIPPPLLTQCVTSGRIRKGKAVELGCGTGNYVMYLASLGFDATGVDISDTAVSLAGKNASEKGLSCHFIAADILGDMSMVRGPFDFAYDWQVLHHIFPEHRETYMKNVFSLLKPQGQYLSLCFSEESSQFGGAGKYRTTPLQTVLYFSSEDELTSLFSPFFAIEEMRTVDIEGKHGTHRAVYAFMTRK
jgi:2-polyprenyl-3-methyl-5-hydroxy-6-metoxy-1,4-benzoquinol methylase